MTPAQRRYIAIETAISIAINTLISIGFVWLVFGGAAHVTVSALVRDAAPQSFMIALMSTIVPTLLTRKRRRAVSIESLPGENPPLLRSLLVRAPLVAVIAALVGVALHAALLNVLTPDGLGFAATMVFKAMYGAALASIVTPIILRLALWESW